VVLIHGEGNVGYLKEINLVKDLDLNAPLVPEMENLKFPLVLILSSAEGLYDMEEVGKGLSQGSRAEYH
jgi:hypothetical protein